jgi:hypothetical protein
MKLRVAVHCIPHRPPPVRQADEVKSAVHQDPGNTLEGAIGVVRPVRQSVGGTSGHKAEGLPGVAWLLDTESFHLEFAALWANMNEHQRPGLFGRQTQSTLHPELERAGRGDTSDLRTRAAQLWSSTDPVIAEHVARLEVSTPEDWAAGFEENHLGYWFRLCLAAHLEAVRGIDDTSVLRTGLPSLGWSSVEARRALFGRELGELALRLDHQGYGQAISLSLGHGHKGWLDADDAITAQKRLGDLEPASFRSAQHLVVPCEQLWQLLDVAIANPERVLILPGTP